MKDPDFRSQQTSKDSDRSNSFLPGIAIGILSTLVLVMGGYIVYQFFNNQKSSTTVNPNESTSIQNNTTQTNLNDGNLKKLSTSSNSKDSKTENTNSSTTIAKSQQNNIASLEIRSRQFVQPAFDNKAEVELLKVNRIPGQANVINVQFRLSVIRGDRGTYEDNLFLPNTTARNPATGATYEPVPRQMTQNIPPIKSMYSEKIPSVDGYVWLQVPEGVNAIDIQIPDAGEFKNVPISDASVANSGNSNNVTIQPGQFTGYAFKNRAKVELLKVDRIAGELNAVKLEGRIVLLQPQEATWDDYIAIQRTTARNPYTSETFSNVSGKATKYSDIPSLKEMSNKNTPSVNFFVWLDIPKDVNVIDVYVPNAQAIKNVPIADTNSLVF